MKIGSLYWDSPQGHVERMKAQKDVKGLTDILKNNKELRINAAFALGEIGKPAVDALLKILKDEDGGVRAAAALALGEAKSEIAVEPLIKTLEKDEEHEVRVKAAQALGDIKDRRAVEPLIKTIEKDDKDEEMLEVAIFGLGRIGDERAVDVLIQALKNTSGYVRAQAARALGTLKNVQAVEPLLEALKDVDGYVRWDAAESLGYLGDGRAVEPLTQALRDESSLVRRSAAETLVKIGFEGIVELLTQYLQDKDCQIKRDAAESLEKIGWKPKNKTEEAYYLIAKQKWEKLNEIGEPAVQPLIHLLKDENKDIRENAAKALERMSWKPKDGTERAYHLIALQKWDDLLEVGEPAVEPLIQSLKDKNRCVREGAIKTLGKIGDRRAVEPLIHVLEDEHKEVRKEAAEALDKMDWKPKNNIEYTYYLVGKEKWIRLADEVGEPAITLLIEFLKKDESLGVLWGTADAMVRIGEPAIEPLMQALKNEDERIRGGAAHALGKMKYSGAVEPLIKALKDESKNVRSKAVGALGKIKDARAVEPLIKALKDKYNCVREEAASALGDLKDERALKPLIQILKGDWYEEGEQDYEEEDEFCDEDEEEECQWRHVMSAAVYALGEIGGEGVKEALIKVIDNCGNDYVIESAEDTLRELREKEMTETLKKVFETSTDFELGDEQECLDEWLHIYSLKKRTSEYYLPIEIELDLEIEVISLCCELWCGLHDVDGDETVKGIANWLREYAAQIRKDAKTRRELGLQLEDKSIDGIHHLNFHYQKNYPPKKIDKLIKDLKKVVEEIY